MTWQQVKEKYPTLDTDKDGMPDWWEIKNGLNPNNKFDAKMDLGGNKLNNLQEFSNEVLHPGYETSPRKAVLDPLTGVSKDWMTYYDIKDLNALDSSKDGGKTTYRMDWDQDLIPNDANSQPEAEGEVTSQKHLEPSMEGVRENIDPSIPANHMIRPNVWRYNDPIGDDKGPGYYTYPTNPVYVPGAFDIVSFEVDATSPDYIVFKITVNADLKQDWGMAADFDVQHFQIYVDEDRIPGSGHIQALPGMLVNFAPDFAWDKMIMVTPQPAERVQVEIDVKAPDVKDDCIIPMKISGQGRTITAVVKKKDMGVTPSSDISKWAWQVLSQSNEGFPDSDKILARNVNEYRGLHRFGGGSDYDGDPAVIDMLVWPALGTLQEAKDQFAMLNVWESYPDPKMDVHAVIPCVANDQTEQWVPKGGYAAFAKEIASKIKPAPTHDKYCSDNFTFSGSVNAQWYFNLDNGAPTCLHPGIGATAGLNETYVPQSYYDNTINSRFTLEWYGKCFTDLVNFYARISTYWDPDSEWSYWQGNYYRDSHGPQYVPVNFESFRFQLVNPIPTVDYISIGNYDYGISPWTVGTTCYPDRDKFKGAFADGSSDFMNIKYNLAWFYPLYWLGLNWLPGDDPNHDNVISGLFKFEPLKGLKIQTTADLYHECNMGSLDTNVNDWNYGLVGDTTALMNFSGDLDVNWASRFGDTSLSFDTRDGMSYVWRGTNTTTTYDTDPSGDHAILTTGGAGLPVGTNNWAGFFTVDTLKLDNMFGSGVKLELQAFYINDYYSMMAARGDYNNSASMDVLDMYGNQSASGYPQDAALYMKYENMPWESVSDGGWKGGTGILEYSLGLLKLHAEYSLWGFNATNYNILPNGTTNNEVLYVITNNSNQTYEAYHLQTDAYAMRGYAFAKYKLDIGNGIDVTLSYMFNQAKNWWPFGCMSEVLTGMQSVSEFYYGFLYTDNLPKITAYYQFTKVLRVGLGFQYRQDYVQDLSPGVTNGLYEVQGFDGLLDVQYSTPLGILRAYIQPFYTVNPRHLTYGDTLADDFRVPLDFVGYRFNVVALTEMDIHF